MILRSRWNATSLLASTALLTLGALPSWAQTAPRDGSLVIAQAPAAAPENEKDKKPQAPGQPPGKGPPPKAPAPGAPPQGRPPVAPPQAQTPPAAPAKPAQSAQPPAAQDRREDRRDQRQPGPPPAPSVQKPQVPAAPTVKQQQPAAPSTVQQPQPPAAPTVKQQQPAAPSTAQQPPTAPSTAQQPPSQERRDERRPGQAPAVRQGQPPSPSGARQPQQPAQTTTPPPAAPSSTAQPPAAGARQPQQPAQTTTPPPAAPSSTAQPPAAGAPSTAQQPPSTPPGQRDDRRRPGQPPAPAAQTPQPSTAPSAIQQPAAAPAGAPATAPLAPAANPAAVPPPTQRRDASQFLQQRGGGVQQPAIGLNQIRQERQETRQGDRVFIREPGRTMIREGDRTIIRHNESERFAIDARDIRVQQRDGGLTETIVVRPDGVRIISITDREGRLVRRVRRDDRDREVVIIDNRFTGAAGVGAAMFLNLAPPVYRGPRERYILDYDPRMRPQVVYDIFEAPPIERIERRYTLDQVRFNAPLRDRMPRVDLDVNFQTGSWQLTPGQVDKLEAIAEGIKRTIQRNPREVFLIEGHTDAVGAAEDNLSLSDRRAEAVAVALTEQFQVPAENLVTQGYGEQYLKVPTQEAELANRRVAVRRITPLIDQRAQNAPPPR